MITLLRKFWAFTSRPAVKLLVILSLLLFTTQPVRADEDFWVDLSTNYTVQETGLTQVEHKFTVTNKTPEFFISKYSLQLSSNQINDVVVTVGSKVISTEITKNGNQTGVTFSFPDKVVGEGKQLNFTVAYTNPDLAQINGQVLELSIPPLAKPDSYRNYQVNLKTPIRFGSANRVTPEPVKTAISPAGLSATFDHAANKGIVAIYGHEQFFQLDLSYHLDNPGDQPILSQISLPPDTPFQRMTYQSLSPLPTSMKQDIDGNWLAWYRLAGHEAIEVTAQAIAHLTLSQNKAVPISQPSAVHLQSEEYWQLGNSELKKVAATHQTPTDIYAFTVDTLSYTTADITQELSRLGAVETLQNPLLATCQEYADLFIALARINKIPARRLVGYAQTKNRTLRPIGLAGDVLHAWPEYYDDVTSTWQSVDPTWGDTTGGVDYLHQFDLNHIVFAINGQSSVLPYPVGSYKPGEKPQQAIKVSFATSAPVTEPNLSATLKPKKWGPFQIPGFYDLTLTNHTGVAWYDLSLKADLAEASLLTDPELPTALLPYQNLQTTITAYNKNWQWPSQQDLTIDILLGTQTSAQLSQTAYVISTFGLSYTAFSYLAMGIGLVIGTGLAGSLLFLGRRRPHSVRR
jgi:hypothetical protein